jgi:hypothetical protein
VLQVNHPRHIAIRPASRARKPNHHPVLLHFRWVESLAILERAWASSR